MTCYDGLQNLFEEYGYFKEKTISITMSGITGRKNQRTHDLIKRRSPYFIWGREVEGRRLSSEHKTLKDGQVETIDFDKADVKYYLTDGSWIAARPSEQNQK